MAVAAESGGYVQGKPHSQGVWPYPGWDYQVFPALGVTAERPSGSSEYMVQGSQSGGMYEHFSSVAADYNELRTTDLEPVLSIQRKLSGCSSLRGTDVGCGGGRYSLLLSQHLPKLRLTCYDVNPSMVAKAAHYLEAHGIKDFTVLQGDIANLSLARGSTDCIFTFNAIHHFDPIMFLKKAGEALCAKGSVFIYTRLRSQNERNVWGRFFPGFSEKEGRLYSLADVESWAESQDVVTLEAIEMFRFKRVATLDQLVRQADGKHYSTFSLYTANEFKQALSSFEDSIRHHFSDSQRIEWFDENVLIVFRKNI